MSGVLKLTVVEASIERDPEQYTMVDCYCQLSNLDQTYKTQVAKGQGLEPKWNTAIDIIVSDQQSSIKLQVFDLQEGDQSSQVGACTIPIQELCLTEEVDEWFQINQMQFSIQEDTYFEGKVHLRSKWIPLLISEKPPEFGVSVEDLAWKAPVEEIQKKDTAATEQNPTQVKTAQPMPQFIPMQPQMQPKYVYGANRDFFDDLVDIFGSNPRQAQQVQQPVMYMPVMQQPQYIMQPNGQSYQMIQQPRQAVMMQPLISQQAQPINAPRPAQPQQVMMQQTVAQTVPTIQQVGVQPTSSYQPGIQGQVQPVKMQPNGQLQQQMMQQPVAQPMQMQQPVAQPMQMQQPVAQPMQMQQPNQQQPVKMQQANQGQYVMVQQPTYQMVQPQKQYVMMQPQPVYYQPQMQMMQAQRYPPVMMQPQQVVYRTQPPKVQQPIIYQGQQMQQPVIYQMQTAQQPVAQQQQPAQVLQVQVAQSEIKSTSVNQEVNQPNQPSQKSQVQLQSEEQVVEQPIYEMPKV